MCGEIPTNRSDPANDMAALISCYTSVRPTNDMIRRLIRERWFDLTRLAHAIHDEEKSFRRDQRKALAEMDNYSKYG